LARQDATSARPASDIMQALFASEIQQEQRQLEARRPHPKSQQRQTHVTRGGSLSRRRRRILAAIALTASISIGLSGVTWWIQSRPHKATPNSDHAIDINSSTASMSRPTQRVDSHAGAPAAPADADTVSVRISGAKTNATFLVNGLVVSNPFSLSQSSTRTMIQIRTPGESDQWIEIVPERDLTVAIPQTPPMDTRRKSVSRIRRNSDNTDPRVPLPASIPTGEEGHETAPLNAPLTFESNPFETGPTNNDPARTSQ
ncbi:MAG: hypothetical protein JXX14_11235, partial [Deltaproteobacteria bacterium]|nr:hypothetical protein [Deltaproteobacteria bacterium]